MAYVVMIVMLSAPALLAFAALRQITEERPRAVSARVRSVEALQPARRPLD